MGSTLHLYYEQYTLSTLFRSSNILLRTARCCTCTCTCTCTLDVARVAMVEGVAWLEWEGDSLLQLAPLLPWEQEGAARVHTGWIK